MHKHPLIQYLPDVSPVVYGCMGLGGGWDKQSINPTHVKQAHECIDAALQSGINYFDHADIYTLGKAEQVFGQVLKERPVLREQMYIQSKCGIRFADERGPKRYDLSAQWITQSVDESLARLNTEYLDVLVLHRPDPLMEPDEIAEAFHRLKSAGKVHYLGVSNMQQQQMAFLQRSLDMPLVLNQIEISLGKLDWLDEGIYAGNSAGCDTNFTPGTLEYCRQNKVQIQSWGSLCQGLFSGRDVSSQAAHIGHTSALVAKLAVEYAVSPEAIVLGWLMRYPAGIQPVIGSINPKRIKASQQAVGLNLSREHWYALYVCAKGQSLP
ncbi:MAG: putative oxidoreductase [Paraglaciecola sp.]|jgi:predicted oxidoreductase